MSFMTKTGKVIGIIPAAGKASRLGRLPFSKELFPVGIENEEIDKYPKVVSRFLLEYMSLAGISEFHFILRNGKWDIPAYYGSGNQLDCSICYHVTEYEYGVPFTLNQANPFVKDKIVALGFPDILLKPESAFKDIICKLKEEENTSVVVGLFPTTQPEKYDMVDFDENFAIEDIVIKNPNQTQLSFAWIIAAWKPEFTAFINSFVNEKLQTETVKELTDNEYYLGDVFLSAIKSGLKIKGVVFNDGDFLDIGTPEDLNKVNSFYSV